MGLSPSRIPKQWDDVTPEWMTAAIASRHPDAKVSKVEIVTRDDGTNRRVRLGLTYSQGSGPATVFLKAHAARNRWVHFRNRNLFNEAQLFRSGVTLPVDHPLVYKAMIEYLRLDFLLVMEDIKARGADPRDAVHPMTVDQVANGLRGLARLHSKFWNLTPRSHPQLKWLQTWKPTQGWQVGLRRRVPTGLERGGSTLPPEVARYTGDQVVDLWVRYVATLTRGPMTLMHSDSHVGNTYVLPNNDVGFLDWQVVRRGEWSQDVGHFLVSALTIEDRRRSEADLIEEYRRALDVPADQRPTKEQAWLRYRTTPCYGLAIWLSTLGTDGWQSREICMALAQRFAAAFAELETLKALDAFGA